MLLSSLWSVDTAVGLVSCDSVGFVAPGDADLHRLADIAKKRNSLRMMATAEGFEQQDASEKGLDSSFISSSNSKIYVI